MLVSSDSVGTIRTPQYSKYSPPRDASTKPIDAPFVVLVDKQEKSPFSFKAINGGPTKSYRPYKIDIESVSLETGDYSLAIRDASTGALRSYEDRFVVERKSLVDLFGSLSHWKPKPTKPGNKPTSGFERFKEEHERMHQIFRLGGQCCVVIEASTHDVKTFQPGHNVSPCKVESCAKYWSEEYKTPWIFSGSKWAAEWDCWDFLMEAYLKIKNELKQQTLQDKGRRT